MSYHHDDERAVEGLKREVEELRRDLHALRAGLGGAVARISELEQQAPQARQLEFEADQAAADVAESGPVRTSADAYWDDDVPDTRLWEPVPRLRRVTCTRTVVTDGNPEPCGLPVDHDPDEKCPGNPHARPAPEASQS